MATFNAQVLCGGVQWWCGGARAALTLVLRRFISILDQIRTYAIPQLVCTPHSWLGIKNERMFCFISIFSVFYRLPVRQSISLCFVDGRLKKKRFNNLSSSLFSQSSGFHRRKFWWIICTPYQQWGGLRIPSSLFGTFCASITLYSDSILFLVTRFFKNDLLWQHFFKGGPKKKTAYGQN